jgi:catechol 2,3-dioxygenase-like lactoylglutathione lyase family enzyme
MIGLPDVTVDIAGAPYHIGLAVPDLTEARRVLGAATGATWTDEQFVRFPDFEFRYVFSVTGPPYLELCEGGPGSPWYCPGEGISLHHLGYWTEDFEADSERMIQAGLAREWDARSGGRKAAYFRAENGSLLELVDVSRRPPLIELIGAARAALRRSDD